jgi:hypothetical protein
LRTTGWHLVSYIRAYYTLKKVERHVRGAKLKEHRTRFSIPGRTFLITGIAVFLCWPAWVAIIEDSVQSGAHGMRGAPLGLLSSEQLVDDPGDYKLATRLNGRLRLCSRHPLLADEQQSINVAAGTERVERASALRPLTKPQEISNALPSIALFASCASSYRR